MYPKGPVVSSDEPFEWSWDPKAFYKLWFDALSLAMDAYLRSPAFLSLMQHGLPCRTDRAEEPIEARVEWPARHEPQIPI